MGMTDFQIRPFNGANASQTEYACTQPAYQHHPPRAPAG